MSNTSAKVKNRYNKKAYDRITICTAKGQKDIIKTYAQAKRESVNALINRALAELMEREPIPGLTFIPMGAERTEEQTDDSQT